MFLLSRWERAVRSAIEIASSVDGVVCELEVEVMCAIASLSKHFMATDMSATGW